MAVMLAVLAGTSVGYPGTPARDRELRVTIPVDVVTLDIPGLRFVTDRMVAHPLMSGLLRFNLQTMEIVPDLARLYRVSPDKLKWTFFLREGVKWHHGYGELTSEDVRFTFERHLDPNTGSLERANYEMIKSIETPERYAVVFNLNEPSGFLRTMLAWQSGFIQSKKFVTERLATKQDLSKSAVGTGPFYLDRYVRGSEVILTANKDYFGGRPSIDTIRFRVVSEELVAVKAVQRGDVDVTLVRSAELYKTLPTPGTRLVPIPGAQVAFAAINTARKPFDDVRVRRALAYAFDMQALKEAEQGGIEIHPTPIPKGMLGSTAEFWTYRPDLQRARQLLTEAGYPSGMGKIVLLAESQTDGVRRSQIIKDLLSRVADVEIRVADPAIQQDIIRRGEWDLYLRGLTRNDPAEYAILFVSDSRQNFGKYAHAGMDEIILRGRRADNRRERERHYRELQKIVADQVFGIYFGTPTGYLLMSSRLRGIYPHPYFGVASYSDARFE